MSTYDVDIVLGGYSFSLSSTDVYNPADTVFVLDGLSMPWSFPSDAPTPAQPDPAACVLGLLTLDVASLDDLEIGDPVYVLVTSAGNTVASFTGRVADPQIDLVRRPSPLGTLTWAKYTILCVDYNVDLSEIKLDLTRPSEPGKDRLEAIAAAIQTATGLVVQLPAQTAVVDVMEALAAVQISAMQLLTDHLSQRPGIATADYDLERYFVLPTTTAGVLTGWTIEYCSAYVAKTWPPGKWQLVANKLTLTFPAGPPAVPGATPLGLAVDAGRIDERGISWRQSKDAAPNMITITGQTVGTVTVANDQAATKPVVLALSTTLTNAGAVAEMGGMYLSDLDTARWWCEQVTWLPTDAELAALDFSLTPDTNAEDFNCYWAQIAIYDVPKKLNPAADNSFYAGSLDGATVTINEGTVSVVSRIRRQLPRSNTLGPSYTQMRAAFPTVKFRTGTNVADPTISYFEARLARKP